MSNERERELIRRRNEILRQTKDLTFNVVESLEQQQKLAFDTKENLHNQNFVLSLANDKIRSMNQDLTSVVNEINEINERQGCLCCHLRKSKKRNVLRQIDSKPIVISNMSETLPLETVETNNPSIIPEIIDNNEQENMIVDELNRMRNQLLVFQHQVKTINKSFEEGDEIIQQLGNETNQYMHSSLYSYFETNSSDRVTNICTKQFYDCRAIFNRIYELVRSC